MTLRQAYAALGNAALLPQSLAHEIVVAARPLALTALGRGSDQPESLNVRAVEVDPSLARGGALIPAWPARNAEGRVTIEFVADWGALLAAWRSIVDPEPWIDDLVLSGQRIWIGIANDVLQLFVPDPPMGSYSMVCHHALMLVAATLWLGPESTQRWQAAHALAARSFLRDSRGRGLWSSVARAEAGLNALLLDPRAHEPASRVVEWLDNDPKARSAYQSYLGAASLGVAALLESEPVWSTTRLTSMVCNEHQRADFNRGPIERFAEGVAV